MWGQACFSLLFTGSARVLIHTTFPGQRESQHKTLRYLFSSPGLSSLSPFSLSPANTHSVPSMSLKECHCPASDDRLAPPAHVLSDPLHSLTLEADSRPLRSASFRCWSARSLLPEPQLFTCHLHSCHFQVLPVP